MQLLHTTFVTPFDRDDIHRLISRMDDVLDLIQDTAESLVLYDIQKVTPEATQLAELVLRCSERVQSAVGLMASMADAPAILKICQEIDKLESEADKVMRGAISELFRNETDVRQLIKLKAVYESARIGDRQVPGRRQRHRKRRARKRLIRRSASFMDLARFPLTLVLLVLLALAFDFMNGFHDAANSIATVVSTGVLKPWQAVLWAAFFNVLAVGCSSTCRVAATVGKGIIDPGVRRQPADLRRADRRHRLESHHLVLRHSVELLARAHRRHDRRRAGQGRHRSRCSRPASSRPPRSSSSRRCSA